jgi:hypothetical protein
MVIPNGAPRLHDVLHSEKKLTLIFDYANTDLKKFMDKTIELDLLSIKVCMSLVFGLIHALIS